MNGMMPNKNIAVKSKKPIITYVLITINVLVYILTAYLSRNIVDSNINVLILLGAKVNSLIANGQYYRLVTAMFLHGGIVHVSLNMYALYSIGPLVENVYGKGKYIVIYFLSGILSSLASFMFSNSISIGASGAIFGLLGAALIFAIKMKNRIGRGFINNIITVIGINLVIGFSIPNIDNFAHLGGLLGGIVISYVVFRNK
jgi:rhomboid protease GluP